MCSTAKSHEYSIKKMLIVQCSAMLVVVSAPKQRRTGSFHSCTQMPSLTIPCSCKIHTPNAKLNDDPTPQARKIRVEKNLREKEKPPQPQTPSPHCPCP